MEYHFKIISYKIIQNNNNIKIINLINNNNNK